MNSKSPQSPLLVVENLGVDFLLHGEAVPAIQNISFDILPGESIALVGESGSGKSVTSQAIMGILPASARIRHGSIVFNDPGQRGKPVDIAKLDPQSQTMRQIRGGSISIIFQEPMTSLSPVHTIGNQISEALFLHRDASVKEGHKLTRTMLQHVGFPNPEHAYKMYPFELSGGLRQRAMIAMAMICHPALLIADEPTTALDVTIQARILKLIRELQQELGMSLLLITHDLGVVANMSEKVVVMYHGNIMESGPVNTLFNNPSHPYLQSLMKAVPRLDMQKEERLTPVREIESGTISQQPPPPWPENDADYHLKVSHISKSYQLQQGSWLNFKHQTVSAVNDVSFVIKPGECFGLVGESGCGKTTLSKMIMRAIQADEGKIEFNDRGHHIDIQSLQGEELLAFRRKMQFIFQDPFSSLSPRMTIFDILREPLQIHQIGDSASQRKAASDLMQQVGLNPAFLNRYPHSFSGGQRQRIGIARALALNPELIICDEPVSALDVSIQAQILNLLKDLQQQMGLTYLFISHNLAVIKYIADRIAVMCRGQLVEIADRDDLFDNPIHPYTQALLSAVPHVDLNQPLDFKALTDASASEPSLWKSPYTANNSNEMTMLEITKGHWVRVSKNCSKEDIAA